jgi:hypothetical protein
VKQEKQLSCSNSTSAAEFEALIQYLPRQVASAFRHFHSALQRVQKVHRKGQWNLRKFSKITFFGNLEQIMR